ncbi:caspase domain-containing protein [Lentinula aciculospora]|uniref:Caspase domain-containing protein n=1 Tax=Lentinula aciculospora TaxID=153920 RepID=A0A9W9AUZ0_9AGAR|nr:caspase domain-containing protein [Lentinula aciculospora]
MPRRGHNILSEDHTELVSDQSPKKKALLIGINNTLMEQVGGGKSQLTMPHRDVQSMRNLLIDHYHYDPNDITILIDIDDPKQLQPTRTNIRTELNKLVADARRGDHFLFHYSGHVVQTENRDHTEEDGKDECLVPCDSDGEQNLIKDDIDYRKVVNSSPFSTRVTPVRYLILSIIDVIGFGSLGFRKAGGKVTQSGTTVPPFFAIFLRRHNALVVYQHKRISNDRVKQRKTTVRSAPTSPLAREIPPTPASPVASPVVSPASTSTHQKLARALTKLDHNATKGINAIRKSSTKGSSISSGQSTKKVQRSRTIKSQFVPWLDIKRAEAAAAAAAAAEEHQEGRQCESPTQEYCQGWCHDTLSPTSPRSLGLPEIISLASCKDSQEAWEDSKNSMTQRLVEILKKDPHPTMSDLMVTISHKLHDAAMKAHTQTKDFKNRAVRHRKKHPEKCYPQEGDTEGLNLNDFQDPQLSSRRPLFTIPLDSASSCLAGFHKLRFYALNYRDR